MVNIDARNELRMRRFSWKKLGDMPLVPFLDTSYEDAVSKVTDALKEEGFGVLMVPWVPHLAVESHHYKSSHRCATVGGHLCSRTWLRRIGWGCDCRCYGVSLWPRLHVAKELSCSHCDALSSRLYRHRPSPFVWKRVISEPISRSMTRGCLRSQASVCT